MMKGREVICLKTEKTAFSLRVPRELLERLKRLARCNKRSANREAEQIIEQHLDRWEHENGKL